MSLLDMLMGTDDKAGVTPERHGEARSFLEWSRSEHFVKLMGWLDREAARPLPLTDAGMVQGAVRSNTLREVAERLRRDIEMARADATAFEDEALHG